MWFKTVGFLGMLACGGLLYADYVDGGYGLHNIRTRHMAMFAGLIVSIIVLFVGVVRGRAVQKTNARPEPKP